MGMRSHRLIVSAGAALACALLAITVPAAQASAPTRNGAHKAKYVRVFSPVEESRFVKLRRRHRARTAMVATWYGPGFFGRRTGCGSTLQESTWGIAHRTLPCGTMVWIRFGGRQVIVPVVDRGPYSGADVDLTLQTADYLGFTGHGRSTIQMTKARRRPLTAAELRRGWRDLPDPQPVGWFGR